MHRTFGLQISLLVLFRIMTIIIIIIQLCMHKNSSYSQDCVPNSLLPLLQLLLNTDMYIHLPQKWMKNNNRLNMYTLLLMAVLSLVKYYPSYTISVHYCNISIIKYHSSKCRVKLTALHAVHSFFFKSNSNSITNTCTP